MLWVKALHIIFMVAWFSGLFYLPRLYVYHTQTSDAAGNQRFKIMEWKLYYMITTPGAVLTIVFGLWLLHFGWSGYIHQLWVQIKLALIALLCVYHLYLGKLLHDFKHDRNTHSRLFYIWINEVPTLFLFSIVFLAVLKPH